MFELSVKKAFTRHEKQMPPLEEDEYGVLCGGFSNFPKTRLVEKNSLNGATIINQENPPHLKVSRFNSFIPYEGKILGFNAFTQKFLVLESVLLDLLNAATLEDNLQGLFELHPTFYQAMCNHGFILNKDVDELQKVKDLREEVDYSNKRYSIIINPTMNCNFKCWYCYESHIKGSKMGHETTEKIKKHITQVLIQNKELEELHVSWFGGEPMLYFDDVVQPIVEHAFAEAEKYGVRFNTSFTTNGYMIREHMIPFLQKYQANHFQITLDGAREKHNSVRFTASKKGTYDTIIKNIRLLCTNQIFVTVRVNYTDETLEKIGEVLYEFADLSEQDKAYMMFSFHNVWQDGNPNTSKLEKVISNFRRHEFTTDSLFASFNTLRDSCYADKKNQVTINYDGEIFKCTARDFKKEDREGMMDEEGNISWNEKFEKRMTSKFKNSPCLSCRIQPICNGGCSQQAMENEGLEYCVVENSGMQKNEIILSKFKQILEHQIIRRAKLVRRINRGIY